MRRKDSEFQKQICAGYRPGHDLFESHPFSHQGNIITLTQKTFQSSISLLRLGGT